MMRIGQELLGHALEQQRLDLGRRVPDRQAGAVGDAKDMRVDRQGRFAEGDVQHHVRRLPADAGQGLERLARLRHLAAMLLDQDAAGGEQVLRLAAEEADRLDRLLERRQAEGEHLLRRRCDREQPARRLVDAAVGRLGREQHRRKQLEHARVFELAARVRIGVAQRREEGNDRGVVHARPAMRAAQEPARAARARASAAATACCRLDAVLCAAALARGGASTRCWWRS